MQHLTDDHRRLFGVAIAMAKADGVLDHSEQAIIDVLTEQLGLGPAAREDLRQLTEHPPTAEQIGRWCATEGDRMGVYALAIRVADADGRTDPAEVRLLDELARVLELSPAQVAEATALGRSAP